LITFIKTHWPKASKELVCEIIFPSKTLKMKKMTKLNWPSGFGRELPVTLHQNQRQLSGNPCVNSRPQAAIGNTNSWRTDVVSIAVIDHQQHQKLYVEVA